MDDLGSGGGPEDGTVLGDQIEGVLSGLIVRQLALWIAVLTPIGVLAILAFGNHWMRLPFVVAFISLVMTTLFLSAMWSNRAQRQIVKIIRKSHENDRLAYGWLHWQQLEKSFEDYESATGVDADIYKRPLVLLTEEVIESGLQFGVEMCQMAGMHQVKSTDTKAYFSAFFLVSAYNYY